MHIPTPKLATRSHYSYELYPPVPIGVAPVGHPDHHGPYFGNVVRVGVMFNTWQGQPRPTTVTATTTTGRSAFASTPLDGFTPGVNEDPRLLDVFADLIADAQQRHAVASAPTVTVVHNDDRDPLREGPTRSWDAHVNILHACQHGNDAHGCTCTATTDHSARVCTGYDHT